MLNSVRIAALAMAAALASSLAYAEDKVATVNGVTIPQARLDMRVKFAASQGQADTPELRKMLRDDLINLEVLSQAAVKKGLDKQPDTVQQVELSRQSALASAYVQDYMKNHPVSEDTLKQAYDTWKNGLGSKEYKVAHILVDKEDEAKAIAAQLKKGGNFAKIAKTKSKDPGSRDTGGEMDWNVPAAWDPAFGQAVVALKKGQVSAPVHSQFGWHIIKLVDVKDMQAPTFEQMKPSLLQRQQQQAVQNLVKDMKASAKIE